MEKDLQSLKTTLKDCQSTNSETRTKAEGLLMDLFKTKFSEASKVITHYLQSNFLPLTPSNLGHHLF